MVHRLVFTPKALNHLEALFDYLAAAASPRVAERFTAGAIDHLDLLTAHPRIGVQRDDIRPGLRTLIYRGRLTIAFVVEDTTVVVLGFYYGGRDVEALLADDEV